MQACPSSGARPLPPPGHQAAPSPPPLQVIKLLSDAYVAAGLELYLVPYGCLPTGYERGVIEVVPHTKSRCVRLHLTPGPVVCVCVWGGGH